MNPSTQGLATIWPAGSSDDDPSPGSRWLSRALCLRYVLTDFRTQHLPVRDGRQVKQVPWRWALGTFRQAEYELLGAWPLELPLPAVLDELNDRGIEHIQAISAEDGMDCTSTYPDAVALSANSDSDAATPFGPRRRAALLSATATAERLQASLTRAIKRQAPFANEGAAVAFLMHALENADRKLQGRPKLRFKTALPRPRAAGTAASQQAA
jgi:hypothetical protein